MNDELSTSDEGLAMLTNFEGIVLHRYLDQAGVMTVGVGHALTPSEKAAGAYVEGITRAEAKELLRADVARAERHVRLNVRVPLEQHQFDVLVSFTFNEGGGALEHSTLLAELNAGRYESVPLELPRWRKRRDPETKLLVEDAGLLARRRAEALVWVSGYGGKTADLALRDAAAAAYARRFSTRELLDGVPDPEQS